MKKNGNLIASIVTILMGILFCILKEGVIDIMMTILGVLFIVGGVIALLSGGTVYGIVLIAIGVIIIIFGWAIKTVVFYVIAILLILVGVLQIAALLKENVKGTKPIFTLIIYLVPILRIAIGVLLFFNQSGTINWILYVTGILLIVDGIIGLITEASK